MKHLSVLMMAIVFLTTTAFANTEGTSELSGNYTGVVSAKTFFESNGSAAKVKSNTQYEVELLFNGTVFILQSTNMKCMGTYKVVGDKVQFEVTSTKGNQEIAKTFFSHDYKFSTSGKKLMLISEQGDGNELVIYTLNKTVS